MHYIYAYTHTRIHAYINIDKMRVLSMKKEAMIRVQLDENLVVSLDKDGNGVDKFEFALGMLEILGVISEADYMPFLEQFKEMDATGDGKLTKDDLRALVERRCSIVAAASQQTRPSSNQSRAVDAANRLVVPSALSAAGFLWYMHPSMHPRIHA